MCRAVLQQAREDAGQFIGFQAGMDPLAAPQATQVDAGDTANTCIRIGVLGMGIGFVYLDPVAAECLGEPP